MSAFSMEFVPGVLEKFGQGIVTAVEESVRPAAQAGSQVLYDQVVQNVNGIKRHTGNLARSIYQVYSGQNEKGTQSALYVVSWNKKKAPHGWLVENGHLQRYEVVRLPNGRFVTPVRPEMRGKTKPGRRASQAVKDAYYIPRRGGPAQIPAKSFLRRAWADKRVVAEDAMTKRLWAEISKRGY
jgi:hypothetical protein